MPMSTDVAIIFGRELFGEPKKQGRVQLKSDVDVVRGTVERFGIPYIQLEGRFTENVPVTGPECVTNSYTSMSSCAPFSREHLDG